MSTVDLLAIGVWLLAAVGVLLIGMAVRCAPSDKHRRIFGSAGVILLGLPVMALIIAFPYHSVLVLATEYILIGIIGGLLVAGARRLDMSRPKLIVMAVLGSLAIGWSVWHIAGDFLLRRARIEGYITEKRIESRGACVRCAGDYFVFIGGRRYLATAEVYEAAEPGQRVRARFGRASRRLIGVQLKQF
jgi:hypothetical protein